MIELHRGDCADVLSQMESCCVDLTVTSPPYDNLRTYNGFTFDFERIARELYRVTKQGGVVVWVVGDATVKGSETGTSFRQALYFKDVCGFNLHDTMIYAKDGISFPDANRYQQSFEYMFVFSKGKPSTKNLIHDRVNKTFGVKFHGKDRSADGSLKKKSGYGTTVRMLGCRWNIWTMYNGRNTGHPAPFPESLAQDHILSWSNEGDTVLDPFLGSGTTGKMAAQLGRKFVGIEISEEYLTIARQRIEGAQQLAA